MKRVKTVYDPGAKVPGFLTLADLYEWPLPHFKPEELMCKGSGALRIQLEAAELLEKLREKYGAPIYIHSAYRSRQHNINVGGAVDSFHVKGRAFDIQLPKGVKGLNLISDAMQVGFTGFGFYRTFLHVDNGPVRWWTG